METTEQAQPFGADVYSLVTEEMYNPHALIALRHIKSDTSENTYRLYKATELEEKVHVNLVTLEAQVQTLRDSLYRERGQVRDLYTTINDDIESNGWTEEDTITLKELSDYLENSLGNRLSFLKEYEAFVTFKVKASIRFKAENSECADEVAQSMDLTVDEDNLSYDGDADVNELYVDSVEVDSVEEQ